MASEIKANTYNDFNSNPVIVSDGSGNVTIGSSGKTITNSGTAVGFGGANTPAFNVWKNTNQSITTNTDTKVTFSDEEFDTNNNFASSTFTPTVAGYYQINASANFSNTAVSSERVTVYIYKNGSQYKRASWNGTSSTTPLNDATLCVSTTVYMNGSTDYLEVYGRETAGGTPEVTGGSNKQTHFSGFKLIE